MNKQNSIAEKVENIIRTHKFSGAFNDVAIENYKKKAIYYYNDKNFMDYNFLTDFHPYFLSDIFKLFYPIIPEEQKFEITLRVYSFIQTPTKNLLDIMIDIKKYRPDENIAPLREFISSDGVITIFRGTPKQENAPQKSLSWTIKENVAALYAINIPRTKSGYIYTAKINIDDVIAYITNRYEAEVIQYNSVYNVEKQRVCIPTNLNYL